MFMKSWEQEFKRHRSSCSPQLLRHPFTIMHTYTVTLDIASHQKQVVYIVLSNKMLSKIVQSFCLQSLCCNYVYTPSWHLSTFYKMRRFIDVLLALVRACREVGVSSRNVVSRTFPQFFHSRLTPMVVSCW